MLSEWLSKKQENLKVYTLLNEAHIEDAFGRNYQNQTNEHAEQNDYIYIQKGKSRWRKL